MVLLPYYIIRYEDVFDSIATDEGKTKALLEECVSLRRQLEDTVLAEDRISIYDQIVELSIRVSDSMLAKQDALRRKVRRSMGGEVLELVSDRVVAAEKEARKAGYAEGRENGYAEGRDEGYAEGCEEGRKELFAKLKELGVDEEILAKALSGIAD